MNSLPIKSGNFYLHRLYFDQISKTPPQLYIVLNTYTPCTIDESDAISYFVISDGKVIFLQSLWHFRFQIRFKIPILILETIYKLDKTSLAKK